MHLSLQQDVKDEYNRAHAERGIGYIECGPVKVSPVDVKEVDNLAESNPINQISKRTAEKQRICQQQIGIDVPGDSHQGQDDYQCGHRHQDEKD